MKDQLKRILNLVQKTGDTMIVTDPNGDDVYVIMGLDQYEDLRNETGFEDEMTDEEWEQYQDDRKKEDDWIWGGGPVEDLNEVDQALDEKKPDIWEMMKPAGEEGETWDLSNISDIEAVDLEQQYKKYAQAPESSSAPEIKIEPKIEGIPPKLAVNEDEFGEEQFYLEPIE